MRRFPAKPDLTPKAPSPPPASRPLPAPAHSYSSVAANNVRSQNGGESGNPAFENDFGSSGFMYSKEMMISLYRPSPMPIEFEKYDIMTSEESLLPMSSQPLTEQEIKVMPASRFFPSLRSYCFVNALDRLSNAAMASGFYYALMSEGSTSTYSDDVPESRHGCYIRNMWINGPLRILKPSRYLHHRSCPEA